mmetsp:Transcript_16740/g.38685  ORF Transcript_16740/g.38685 Transcript_16740/m.38685 type:complete len:89 (+) Transcript_16740:1545-1811(+)
MDAVAAAGMAGKEIGSVAGKNAGASASGGLGVLVSADALLMVSTSCRLGLRNAPFPIGNCNAEGGNPGEVSGKPGVKRGETTSICPES